MRRPGAAFAIMDFESGVMPPQSKALRATSFHHGEDLAAPGIDEGLNLLIPGPPGVL